MNYYILSFHLFAYLTVLVNCLYRCLFFGGGGGGEGCGAGESLSTPVF